jgi:hypothetical protein
MAARLLAVMGSGETTPTMAKPHRELFSQLDPGPVKAVIVDTPYGFQLNAADISARAVRYFKETVGREVEIASLQRTEGVPSLTLESALARVAEAQWLFSGPGSPTYALRQWRPTVVPQLLSEKLALGGCVVFSSAAALTLGRWTVPVYEIYKAGADLCWAEGLDLLAPYGLQVAVIPHYDNAEGGTHDTRYCYLGEPRLLAMEQQLPDEAWVLGVDEHTACVFDLEAGTVSVSGLGSVTVRRRGRSRTVPAGTVVGIKELVALAFSVETSRVLPSSDALLAGKGALGTEGDGRGDRSPKAGKGLPAAAVPVAGERGSAPASGRPVEATSPLLAEVGRLSDKFDSALAARDAGGATEAVLEMERVVHEWSADTFQSDELDRGRAELRRMIVRLGEAAATGLADPRAAAAPWVEALLAERAEARESRRYADADRIRDNLLAAGVEVRDTPAGTEWDLRQDES